MEPSDIPFTGQEKKGLERLAKMLSSSFAPMPFIQGSPDAAGAIESRLAWIEAVSGKLSSAVNIGDFKTKLLEAEAEIQSRLDASPTPSEEAFVKRGASDIRSLAHIVGRDRSIISQAGVAEGGDKPLDIFLKKAFSNKRQNDGGAVFSAEAGDGLLAQKKAVARQFGFGGVVLEGEHLLTKSQAAAVLAEAGKAMAAAAKRMGVADQDMGLGMSPRLAVTHPNAIGKKFFSTLGSVALSSSEISAAGRVLNFNIRQGSDIGVIIHEWTHLLDASLGQRAAGLAKEALMPAPPGRFVFFSNLPLEVQRLMPDALLGLNKIQAAAQQLRGGVAELAALRDLNASRQASTLSAIATSLAGGDGALLGASAEARAAFISEVRSPLLSVLRSPEAALAVVVPGESFESLWRRAPADGQLRTSAAKVANVLERHFGAQWLPNVPIGPKMPWMTPLWSDDGVDSHARAPLQKMDPMTHLEEALGKIITPKNEKMHRLVMEHSSDMAPMNMHSEFAMESRLASVAAVVPGYWDATHEMLARTTGRPPEFFNRIWDNAVSGGVNSPRLGSGDIGAMGEGWEMLTKASPGIQEAARFKFNAGERLEAVGNGVVGKAVLASMRSALALQHWDDPHAPILRKVASWEASLARKIERAGLVEPMRRLAGSVESLDAAVKKLGDKLSFWKSGRNRSDPEQAVLREDAPARSGNLKPPEPELGLKEQPARPDIDDVLRLRMQRSSPAIKWSSAGTSAFHAGVGVLSLHGAIAAAKSAREEARNGNVAMASLGAAEAGAQSVVAASSAAALVGSAKLASATKVAGPLGAALGYFGAARSAYHAREEGKLGNAQASEAHARAALIRAGGATGSLAASVAASMAVGAAAGSVAPIVGTAVGAVVGIGVALVAEHYAQKEDQAAEAAPASFSQKLAQRRQGQQAMASPQSSGFSRQRVMAP